MTRLPLDGMERRLGNADRRDAEQHADVRRQSEGPLVHDAMAVAEDQVWLDRQRLQRLDREPPLAECEQTGAVGHVRLARHDHTLDHPRTPEARGLSRSSTTAAAHASDPSLL